MSEVILSSLNNLASQDKMIRKYVQEVRKDPDQYYNWIKLGNILTRHQNELALQCYQEAIKLNENSTEAWNNKGIALRSLGKYQEAIECFDRILQSDPTNDRALRNKGFCLYLLGNYRQSIQLYEKAIDVNPDFPHVWYNKGLAFYELGKYEEAIKSYDSAIDRKLFDTDVTYNMGLALYKLGRYDKAIEWFDKAIDLNPTFSDALNNKGLAFSSLEKHSEAILCFHEAIKYDPNSPRKSFNLGQSQFALEEYDSAIQSYDKALSFDPGYIDALNSKGQALASSQRYREALIWFDKALLYDPLNSSAWFNKGYCLFKEGHYTEAAYCYNKVLNIDSDDIYALGNLASIYSDYTLEYDKGYEISLRLLSILESKNYQGQVLEKKVGITEDLIKLGKYEEAREHALRTSEEIEKAIKEDSLKRNYERGNIYLSIIKFFVLSTYMLGGDLDKGKKELRNFIQYHRNPDNTINLNEDEWVFNGLIELIKKKNLSPQIELLLLAVIDFLKGKIDIETLSNNTSVFLDGQRSADNLTYGNNEKTKALEKVEALSNGIHEIEETVTDLSKINVPKVKGELEKLREKVEDL